MYKEIEAYVINLTLDECQKTLVGALCDLAKEADLETFEEVKEYAESDFLKAMKHIRSLGEDGLDE